MFLHHPQDLFSKEWFWVWVFVKRNIKQENKPIDKSCLSVYHHGIKRKATSELALVHSMEKRLPKYIQLCNTSTGKLIYLMYFASLLIKGCVCVWEDIYIYNHIQLVRVQRRLICLSWGVCAHLHHPWFFLSVCLQTQLMCAKLETLNQIITSFLGKKVE